MQSVWSWAVVCSWVNVSLNCPKPATSLAPASLRRLSSHRAKKSVRRRGVPCPYAVEPPPCDGGLSGRIWRQATPLASMRAGAAEPVTEADQDYHAGAGAAVTVSTDGPAQELDFSARIRLLHDRDYLYVAVEVTAPRFFPLREHFGKPFSQPDSVCVEFSRIQYGIAPTKADLVLMGGGPIRTDLRARASVTRPTPSKLVYTAALPRAHTMRADIMAPPLDRPSAVRGGDHLDVDLTVFHGEDVDRRTRSLPAIPFHLTLLLEGDHLVRVSHFLRPWSGPLAGALGAEPGPQKPRNSN